MEEEDQAGEATALRDYERPPETGLSFKYLGRLLTATDDDCPAVIDNLRKAKKSWSQLAWILGREGADTRKSERFYVAIIQSFLLFGLEAWVVTPCIKRLLRGFHHRAAQRILGNFPRRRTDGTWE